MRDGVVSMSRNFWAILLLAACSILSGCAGSNGPGDGSIDQISDDGAWDATPIDAEADSVVRDALPEAWTDAGTDVADTDQDLFRPEVIDTDGTDDIEPDAVDAGADVAGDAAPDTGACWKEPIDCSATTEFDYKCTMGKPETCPGGLCAAGLCIGPMLDQDRWAACDDDCCDPCEAEGGCPADCGPGPEFSGTKEYDNATTISIWVHGWSNTNPDEEQYGRERGCGGILQDAANFGVVRPCSKEDGTELAPNQIAKFEYFGNTPASWLTPEQIAEIEQYPLGGPKTLHRYALITAMYIRHKLDQTGATHVNLACHSYGCLISRYMMENNLLGLAAENRFVRWFTSAGVLAGARLARLYDNTSVREVADLFGISQGDFIVMNPDFVMDNAAAWNHRLYRADSPYLGDMIIHHTCGDDPRIKQALNIALLDLNNPGDEPNDGIMYTLDTFFHDQDEPNRFHSVDGTGLLPSHSYVYVDHMAVPEAEGSVALCAAALFHGRKVEIVLKDILLKDDLESDWGLDKAPAEIVVEHQVRYSPYLPDTFGRNPLISENLIDYRTPEMFQATQGQSVAANQVIFAGPVFDDQQDLWLKAEILEADWYPRFDVRELALGIGDKHDALITFQGQVELRDHEFVAENEKARITIAVRVFSMY